MSFNIETNTYSKLFYNASYKIPGINLNKEFYIIDVITRLNTYIDNFNAKDNGYSIKPLSKCIMDGISYIINACNNSRQKDDIIIIGEDLSFHSDKTNPDVGGQIKFTDKFSGDLISISWSFIEFVFLIESTIDKDYTLDDLNVMTNHLTSIINEIISACNII